jgi:hypothetical protein
MSTFLMSKMSTAFAGIFQGLDHGNRGAPAAGPPGHDAWTEGKEACVLIDVTGVKNYAKPA